VASVVSGLILAASSTSRALNIRSLPPSPKPSQKNLSIFRHYPHLQTATLKRQNDKRDKMGSSAYQTPTVTINSNIGNVTDSYKNVWNNCEISVLDERRQILEWLSPMAPRERHRAVSEGWLDGVGEWLLGTSEFERWYRGEDQAAHPVLFCYGDPGVGKTYLRCVKVVLLK